MAHPERLGKYRITSVLGEGAMGVVYRAFDPDIRRVVALKTIRKAAGEGIESAAMSAARFRNEAHAAGRLLHPGIVGVYDFGDTGFGSRHRDLSYSNWISADLTLRIIDRYEALTKRKVDRERVMLYSSALRLAELAEGFLSDDRAVASVVHWVDELKRLGPPLQPAA